MNIKDYTYNDYLLWWPIDKIVENVIHDYIIVDPSDYVQSTLLFDAKLMHTGSIEHPQVSLSQDFVRSIADKLFLGDMFMSSIDNGTYSATSGSPIEYLGSDVLIKFKMLPEHKNLVPGDYWYGTEKPEVFFNPLSMATYFLRCSLEGKFIEPGSWRLYEPVVCSIFCPKEPDELQSANVMSYLAFDGLFDCEAIDEEFRKESGIDTLLQTRNEACYI